MGDGVFIVKRAPLLIKTSLEITDEDVYSFIPLLLVSFAEFLPHSLTFIRRYI